MLPGLDMTSGLTQNDTLVTTSVVVMGIAHPTYRGSA